MKCRICESTEHFAAKCPNKGKGGPPPQLYRESEPSMTWNEWSSSSNHYVSMFSMSQTDDNRTGPPSAVHLFSNDSDGQSHARVFMNSAAPSVEGQSPTVSSRRNSYDPPTDVFQFGSSHGSNQDRPRSCSRDSLHARPSPAVSESNARPWNIYADEPTDGWPSPRQPVMAERATETEVGDHGADKEKTTYRMPDSCRVKESEMDLPNYADIWTQGRMHTVPRLTERLRRDKVTPVVLSLIHI